MTVAVCWTAQAAGVSRAADVPPCIEVVAFGLSPAFASQIRTHLRQELKESPLLRSFCGRVQLRREGAEGPDTRIALQLPGEVATEPVQLHQVPREQWARTLALIIVGQLEARQANATASRATSDQPHQGVHPAPQQPISPSKGQVTRGSGAAGESASASDESGPAPVSGDSRWQLVADGGMRWLPKHSVLMPRLEVGARYSPLRRLRADAGVVLEWARADDPLGTVHLVAGGAIAGVSWNPVRNLRYFVETGPFMQLAAAWSFGGPEAGVQSKSHISPLWTTHLRARAGAKLNDNLWLTLTSDVGWVLASVVLEAGEADVLRYRGALVDLAVGLAITL